VTLGAALVEWHLASYGGPRNSRRVREIARGCGEEPSATLNLRLTGSNLAVKLDPAGHRTLSFGLGLAIVVALVILDAIPLNWAARAFGLNFPVQPDWRWSDNVSGR
jgi:hypothetical protein